MDLPQHQRTNRGRASGHVDCSKPLRKRKRCSLPTRSSELSPGRRDHEDGRPAIRPRARRGRRRLHHPCHVGGAGCSGCPAPLLDDLPGAISQGPGAPGDRGRAPCLHAAVDSQIAEDARVDWRRDQGPILGTWRPYELPKEIEERLLGLLNLFGLEFGTIDIILTPEGRYVFLEANPLGSFSWLETNLWDRSSPISGAVADILLRSRPAACPAPESISASRATSRTAARIPFGTSG